MQLIHETIDLKALSRVSGVQTPSLNDCVVTNKTFCIVLLCFLIQIPLFFQLWALAMKITVVTHSE